MANSKDILKDFRELIGEDKSMQWLMKWRDAFKEKLQNDILTVTKFNVMGCIFQNSKKETTYAIVSSNDILRDLFEMSAEDIDKTNKKTIRINKTISPGGNKTKLKAYDFIRKGYITIDLLTLQPICGIMISVENILDLSRAIKALSK